MFLDDNELLDDISERTAKSEKHLESIAESLKWVVGLLLLIALVLLFGPPDWL